MITELIETLFKAKHATTYIAIHVAYKDREGKVYYLHNNTWTDDKEVLPKMHGRSKCSLNYEKYRDWEKDNKIPLNQRLSRKAYCVIVSNSEKHDGHIVDLI